MKKLNLVYDSRDVKSKGDVNISCLLARAQSVVNMLRHGEEIFKETHFKHGELIISDTTSDCANIISSLLEVIIKLDEELKTINDHYEKELDLVNTALQAVAGELDDELTRRINSEY